MIFNERDQELRDLGYQKHAFNMLISNRLGYHRDVPDTRNAAYAPYCFLLIVLVTRCFHTRIVSHEGGTDTFS